MKACTSVVVLLAVVAWPAISASAASLTFEEFLGFDETPIGTFYSGITFAGSTTGSDWVARDATTGVYNVSSWPTGTVYGSGLYWINALVSATTALDSTGDDGIITLDNADATYFQLNYSSASQLSLTAYDASNSVLDTASGPANLRYIDGNEAGPGTLRVDWDGTNYISRIVVSDQGNYWTVDNIETDASGITIIPIPMALPQALVLMSLLGGCALWRRK